MLTRDGYRELFNTLPDPAVLVTESSGRYTILDANRMFLKQMSLDFDRLLGADLFETLPELRVAGKANDLLFLLEQVHKTGQAGSTTYRRLPETERFDPSFFGDRLKMTATPIRTDGDEPKAILIRWIPQFSDTTESDSDVPSQTPSPKTPHGIDSASGTRHSQKDRFLESLYDAFIVIDADHRVRYWNERAETISGIDRTRVIGKKVSEPFPAIREMNALSELDRASREKIPIRIIDYYPPDKAWLEINIYPTDEGNHVFFRDITRQKETFNRLQEMNRKLEVAQKIGKLGYWEHILKTDELYWSDEVYRIFGVDRKRFSPDVNILQEKLHPDDKERFFKHLRKAMRGEVEHDIEYRILMPDGSLKWVNERGANRYDEQGKAITFEGTLQDITDKKRSEEMISRSLREKEILLAEIHHRVKNNLAVVSSLLEVQALNSDNEALHQELIKATLRVRSIAGIHEQLYQSEDFAEIPFYDGIKTLIDNIVQTLQTRTHMDIRYDMEEVHLNINQGIPCSLLVNEILTNTLKHGFEGHSEGTLLVRLREKNHMVELQIEDDGNGLPDGFDPESENSTGITLIQRLTEQLQGSCHFSSPENGTGCLFTLRFPRGSTAQEYD